MFIHYDNTFHAIIIVTIIFDLMALTLKYDWQPLNVAIKICLATGKRRCLITTIVIPCGNTFSHKKDIWIAYVFISYEKEIIMLSKFHVEILLSILIMIILFFTFFFLSTGRSNRGLSMDTT